MSKPVHQCTRCHLEGTVPEVLRWDADEPWLARCFPECDPSRLVTLGAEFYRNFTPAGSTQGLKRLAALAKMR